MPFILFILFSNLLLVAFGQFSNRNKPDDYEKKWMKKSNKNILPTEVLHRSKELEYIKYIMEQNAKSEEYNMLRRVIPVIMLRNWTEPLVLINTDPDEQAVYFPMTEWEKSENGNRESESMFEKSVVSPANELMNQLLEHAAATKNDLLNDDGLKKGLELNTGLEQPNINGTLEEQNITEVYEEPFIQIHVKPLCKGSNC
ncbi:unnamed protein product [Cercopithifilaria johnstoni]|uniref:Uncharacterized protein n=1 Tax=Cercopithifilaria johnstoni TaxID=2874296 RepID=A0A8J2MMJ4_9BILA|nr:unnamed protein product [Cercopithifilaria johnstoni]